jgi:hypothetical protein
MQSFVKFLATPQTLSVVGLYAIALSRCNEPILSLLFRFCPYCGQPYKDVNNQVS